jgi:hypothetical protein
MVDEFEQIRDALNENARRNGKLDPGRIATEIADDIRILLDNQRVICATLAVLVRGGHAPIEMARDLQDRAKKITKILEG